MIQLRVQFVDGRVEDREWTEGTYAVGREAGDLVLSDPKVSGRHAAIHVTAEGVRFHDLGSTNGSYTPDGQRISAPYLWSPGTVLTLGMSKLTLVRGVPQVAGTQVMAASELPSGPVDGFAATAFAGSASPLISPFAGAPVPAAAPVAPAVAPAPVPVAAPIVAAPVSAAVAPAAPVSAPLVPAGAPSSAVVAAVAQGSSSLRSAPQRSGPHSHPDSPVRHDYPLHIQSASIGTAFGLVMKTLPFVLVRFAILGGVTLAGLIWWGITFGGWSFLSSKVHQHVGTGWLVANFGAMGWMWRAVVRYFLYLVKAAHIAVLTELITTGAVQNGNEGMFQYGIRVVKERFGEVNVLFALDLLISGIVSAFNRTLDFVTGLIPIPGLQSVAGMVKAVVHASTTYIDETIFSYNLARGDENAFRSAKDGLIYYAQNSKEILKTGIWAAIVDKVLSVVIWVIMLAPGFFLAWVLPASVSGMWVIITAFVVAFVFANDVRSAFVKPLLLTMVMIKFHTVVQGQAINAEWDGRLERVSKKFVELKDKAINWVAPKKDGAQPAAAA